MTDLPPEYDEKAIAKAQEAWREQDLETWRKTNPGSIKRRHEALLDLLCAHVPTNAPEPEADETPKPKPPRPWPPY